MVKLANRLRSAMAISLGKEYTVVSQDGSEVRTRSLFIPVDKICKVKEDDIEFDPMIKDCIIAGSLTMTVLANVDAKSDKEEAPQIRLTAAQKREADKKAADDKKEADKRQADADKKAAEENGQDKQPEV